MAVLQAVFSEMTGNVLSNNISHFSLGLFYINTDLVEQHPAQRAISSSYVDELVQDFEQTNILRTECPGVVIGLNGGWKNLKNTGGAIYRISSSSSCIDMLRGTSGGPIAQVIRGGHRTEAIRCFSGKPDMSDENYWCYNVLLPSRSL